MNIIINMAISLYTPEHHHYMYMYMYLTLHVQLQYNNMTVCVLTFVSF